MLSRKFAVYLLCDLKSETLCFILPSTVYDSPVKRSLLPLTAGGLEPTDVRFGDGVPLLKKNQKQKEKYFMLRMFHKLGLQITAKVSENISHCVATF